MSSPSLLLPSLLRSLACALLGHEPGTLSPLLGRMCRRCGGPAGAFSVLPGRGGLRA